MSRATPDPNESDPDDFSFDLDRALSRLHGSSDDIVDPAAVDPAAVHPGPTFPTLPMPAGEPVPLVLPDSFVAPAPVSPPAVDLVVDALPPIHEATPVGHPATSVVPLEAPEFPGSPTHGLGAPLVFAGAGAQAAMASAAHGGGPSLGMAKVVTGEMHMLPASEFGLPRLPTLAPAPIAPPSPPTAVHTTPAFDPTAMRSAPGAARRQPSKGRRRRNAPRRRKLGMRAILIVLMLGAVVLASLTWGRSYLFPDEWDAVLVPLVEDVEELAGLNFEQPVAVRLIPGPEYGAAAAEVILGEDWPALVPRWRAFGLASGEPAVAAVETVLAFAFPALYDPAEGEIISSENLAGRARTVALTEALTVALIDQHLSGSLDSDDRPALGTGERARAARVLAAQVTAGSLGSVPSRVPLTGLGGLPTPVTYEVLAVDRLGAAFARSAGVPVAGTELLAALTTDDLDRLAVPGIPAPPGAQSGDVVDGDAAALGSDAWFLVFASFLDGGVANQAADAIGSDLMIPTARGESSCVVATFTIADPALDGLLRLALGGWVNGAPLTAGASTSTLADGTHQLSVCDPGDSTVVVFRPTAAAELVERQAARLVAGG